MITVRIKDLAAEFAEDKDAAAEIREQKIRPALKSRRKVILDFAGVTLATQSFVHALISDILRTFGPSTLDLVEFKNCVKGVRGIVGTVVEYSLEGRETERCEKSGRDLEARTAAKKKK
jgi:hypothetical protein